MIKNKNVDTNWVPKKQIKGVLDREFINPFIDSIRYDPLTSLKLSNAFVLLGISESLIVAFDKSQVEFDKATDKVKEKNLYLGYLGKIFQSALLLIGSTDYLGAMILFRAVFELLIGISTEKNGSMKERRYSIEFINVDEKETIHRFWNELNAWAHPHGKWSKNICPKFYGVGRNYHPAIFEKCLNYTDTILDLMLTITIDHFKITPRIFLDNYKDQFKIDFCEISNVEMFKRRLKKNP